MARAATIHYGQRLVRQQEGLPCCHFPFGIMRLALRRVHRPTKLIILILQPPSGCCVEDDEGSIYYPPKTGGGGGGTAIYSSIHPIYSFCAAQSSTRTRKLPPTRLWAALIKTTCIFDNRDFLDTYFPVFVFFLDLLFLKVHVFFIPIALLIINCYIIIIITTRTKKK